MKNVLQLVKECKSCFKMYNELKWKSNKGKAEYVYIFHVLEDIRNQIKINQKKRAKIKKLYPFLFK